MSRYPSAIKRLLRKNYLWARYCKKHQRTIRPVVVDTITQILACGTKLMGYARHHCSNPNCNHCKRTCFGCKNRYCNTCGKKRTDQWIENISSVLPNVEWQHITFTIPAELWPIFKDNRHLLNQLSSLAAKTLLKFAKKKGVNPGVFTALHTFGRDLKWNTHIHLSISRGGLSDDNQLWKDLYYPKANIMKQWRYAIITLLRKAYKKGELVLPEELSNDISWNSFLDQHYSKSWIVHFSKATKNPIHTIKYLGRYVTRPPLAMSRLEHYDGTNLEFKYLDHKTKRHLKFSCSGEEFLHRWTQHIPEKGFRMIRYYGFLSNRTRSTLLPIIYEIFEQVISLPDRIRYPQLLEKSFGLNPFICILCGSPMLFSGLTFGKSTGELAQYHVRLAMGRSVY